MDSHISNELEASFASDGRTLRDESLRESADVSTNDSPFDAALDGTLDATPDASCRTPGPCVPSGVELCDGIDNDCNELTDEPNVCGPIVCRGINLQGGTYTICEGSRSWAAARDACLARGQTLLSLETDEERYGVAAMISAALSGGIITMIDWWVGGSDLACENNWRWETGAAIPLRGWLPGEPNGADLENCAAVHLAGELQPHLRYDVACTERKNFICEGPGIATFRPWTDRGACETPITPLCGPSGTELCNGRDDDCNGMIDESGCPPTNCTNVAIPALGVTYRMCRELLTIDAARHACRNAGMVLARIDSAAEADELAVAFRGPANPDAVAALWVQGSDANCEGTWVDDNNTAAFTRWAVNEPNDGNGKGPEHCIELRYGTTWSGTMNDVSCVDALRPYVCAPSPG